MMLFFFQDSLIYIDPKIFNSIVMWVKYPTPFVATLNISAKKCKYAIIIFYDIVSE